MSLSRLPAPPVRRGRLAAALAISVIANAGIVGALGNLRSDRARDAERSPRATLTVAELAPPPPPPPPPSRQEPASPGLQAQIPNQAPPPSLELPPPVEGGAILPFPDGDGDGLGWGLGDGVPGYAARSEVLGEAKDFDFKLPEMLFQPSPVHYYPPRARGLQLEGRSEVRVEVDSRGVVRSAEILFSTPLGIFDDAAIRVAKATRFRPASLDGQPMPFTGQIIIQWDPR